MIPAWLARCGAKLLPGLLAAGGLVTLIVGVFRRGQKQAELEHAVEDAKARREAERRMAAAPRVGSDADLVERLRRGGF